ncbi:MAG: HPr family phosphocarrier protein [Candidatus Omnitrophica bacterium]|nr:HPr family phosphocarrier protein [Candidatus Omnitrophota bacterium]
MIKKKVKIANSQGLHARPASLFVKIANKYQSDITVRKGSETVNGKSIMGLMTLAAQKGSTIEIQASGADAEPMLEELEKFLLNDKEDGA